MTELLESRTLTEKLKHEAKPVRAAKRRRGAEDVPCLPAATALTIGLSSYLSWFHLCLPCLSPLSLVVGSVRPSPPAPPLPRHLVISPRHFLVSPRRLLLPGRGRSRTKSPKILPLPRRRRRRSRPPPPARESPRSSLQGRSRRRQQQHHGKRKKKPPPASPLLLFSAAPMRMPPSPALSSASHRAASRKSPAKNEHRLRHNHSKKSAATGGKPAMPPASSSWEQLKSLLSCRSATAASRVHAPAALTRTGGGGTWSSSLCSMRDVAVDGASSAASVDHCDTAPLNHFSRRHHRAATSSSTGGGHPSSLRCLSGCYECRAINVEPVSRLYPRPRELCPCSQCGEVFTKADSLEQHQAIRHAGKKAAEPELSAASLGLGQLLNYYGARQTNTISLANC